LRTKLVIVVAAMTLAAFAACSDDDTSPTPVTLPDADVPPPPPGDDATPPPKDAAEEDIEADAPDFPVGKGDPCRGDPLPSDQHFVPKGMCARAVASGLVNMRELTFAPNGDLFGVNLNGTIFLFRDDDGDGVYAPTEVHNWGFTGGNGNNCHLDGAYVYAGSVDGVVRFPYVASSTTAGGPPEDVVVGQPSDGGHGLHTTHVYDKWLYVQSGSLGDASDPMSPEYDTQRALLRRFDLSTFTPGAPFAWLSGEVVTVGLRNTVGFTRNAAGRMYGVVNGMDNAAYQGVSVVEDNPGEQIVELGVGKKYGYPFCYTAQRLPGVTAGTQVWNAGFGVHDDAWCAANSMQPATFAQAHSAPLDIVFFDVQPKGALPARWRGGAFVSFHGSAHRTVPTGYKVVWIPFDASGKSPMPVSTALDTTFPYETVFGGGDTTGPKDGPWTWTPDGGAPTSPRPVGVAISPIDGALYVSSDASGYIYRVGQPH
jgi:glucose/arabinose dehydrogenase